MNISFNERELRIDELVLRVEFPITNAFAIRDRVIVLYDPNAVLRRRVPSEVICAEPPSIKNLVAYSKRGEKLWEAEFPVEPNYYYRVEARDPLIASAFSSHDCEISLDDGHILQCSFYK